MEGSERAGLGGALLSAGPSTSLKPRAAVLWKPFAFHIACHVHACLQVYPDVGVAAMLKNQWTDATFGFASLNDRWVGVHRAGRAAHALAAALPTLWPGCQPAACGNTSTNDAKGAKPEGSCLPTPRAWLTPPFFACPRVHTGSLWRQRMRSLCWRRPTHRARTMPSASPGVSVEEWAGGCVLLPALLWEP